MFIVTDNAAIGIVITFITFFAADLSRRTSFPAIHTLPFAFTTFAARIILWTIETVTRRLTRRLTDRHTKAVVEITPFPFGTTHA
jgi:di/tricarboxylate transporter